MHYGMNSCTAVYIVASHTCTVDLYSAHYQTRNVLHEFPSNTGATIPFVTTASYAKIE